MKSCLVNGFRFAGGFGFGCWLCLGFDLHWEFGLRVVFRLNWGWDCDLDMDGAVDLCVHSDLDPDFNRRLGFTLDLDRDRTLEANSVWNWAAHQM